MRYSASEKFEIIELVEQGSVQNLSHIYSGDGFGLHDLRLIERSHVHVALGGPCRAGDVAQPRGR